MRLTTDLLSITMASLTLTKSADLQIPKLNATNYKPWKELVTAALEGRGVWEYAEGISQSPKMVVIERYYSRIMPLPLVLLRAPSLTFNWATLRALPMPKRSGLPSTKYTNLTIARGSRDFSPNLSVSDRLRRSTKPYKLSRLQSEIRSLDAESKPSDTLKTEMLLGSLGPEYDATIPCVTDTGGLGTFPDPGHCQGIL